MTENDRENLASEIWAYADSLDEFMSLDDIYAGLVDLGREVMRGDYG